MIGRHPDRTSDSSQWWEGTVADDVELDDEGWPTRDGRRLEVHADLVGYVDWLRDRDSVRLDRAAVHASVYEGSELAGFGRAVVDAVSAGGVPEQQLNFVRNVVDSVHVKVTRSQARVKAVCVDADFSYFNRARRLTRALAAEFDRCDVAGKSRQVARDAEVVGDGLLKVYVDWDARRVQVDVVPASEVFVDPREARYGEPRQLHHVKQMSRDALRAMFPDRAADVDGAPASRSDAWSDGDPDDVVDVFESWLLPSRRFDADEPSDGRHAICVGNATLLLEELRARRFPLARFSWWRPLSGQGFWGRPLVEKLARTQWEIDRVVGQIQYALEVGARTKVIVDRAADVNLDHLTHPAMMGVVEVGPQGRPPQVVAPDPVSPQLLQWLQVLVDRIYQTSGMSQDAASSEKPAGLNSGVALLHFHDFQTEKYLDQARRLQDLSVDVAELMVDCMRDLAEDEGYSVRWHDRDLLREIDWGSVDMDRDRFVLRLEAVSELPDTYAGQLDIITQLSQNGQVPQQYVTSLFEDPDLWRRYRQLNADDAWCQRVVELLCDVDVPPPDVDPATNLEMAVDVVRAAYLDALTLEDPRRPDPALEAALDRFRGWLDLARIELQRRQAQGAPPGPTPPPPDPGAPPTDQGPVGPGTVPMPTA